MQFKNITSYLNNKTYNINLTPNKLYINNYNDIIRIKETEISVNFDSFILTIIGNDFKVIEMIDNEVLFSGQIKSMEYDYKQ